MTARIWGMVQVIRGTGGEYVWHIRVISWAPGAELLSCHDSTPRNTVTSRHYDVAALLASVTAQLSTSWIGTSVHTYRPCCHIVV